MLIRHRQLCLHSQATTLFRAPSCFLGDYRLLRRCEARSSSTRNDSYIPTDGEHAVSHRPVTNYVPLRLMPLGGSITYGVGSSDKNGYRKQLYDMLTSDGYVVEMVGSRKSGMMLNNENEGWRGFTIDQIKRKACESVPLLLPNLITLNAGSNDCLQNIEIDQIGKRIDSMLEYIWHTSPGSTIILSTLLPTQNTATEQLVMVSNAQLQELALQKSKQNKKIVLVDMHSTIGPNEGDLIDGVHPNDFGYHKMAIIWHNGFREAIKKGYLHTPVTGLSKM